MNINLVNFLLELFAGIGFLLSVYAYNVEVKLEEDTNYVAMCDFSEHMSCTKAFSSEYGKGFGLTRLIFGEDSALNLPNGALG
ncbi:LOW QUALITY PROTEIN: vitamin K epoxide reductase complex subunit 1-like protein 1 [Nilaparvata lugens]|uniref:LOW QUALITY PROTEIN: vitamin K epoxide reductase complex subunit 1-like protein 1 n=1 Tax=Nilaparvata lugens TaxID=108931 RepID=UPI00193DEE5F|nr:LOW QUALITY PROTEIN: vitamin K epoxide reductase complex subunit 1-like protein 1 [Nilaparvata lugens]